MNNIRRFTDISLRLLPLIVTILIYWFGVVKNTERQRAELFQQQRQITEVVARVEKLDNKKADNYKVDIIMNTLDKIDNKIDKLQERIK